VLARMKKALGEKVADVKFTHRLTDSPACIVATDDGMTTQMAKLMQSAGQPVPEPKYSFELNPEHPLVKIVSDVQDEEQFAQWTQVLFDQAALSEQGSLKEPASFVKNLNTLLANLVK
jgi:molecular chaperone HtpG